MSNDTQNDWRAEMAEVKARAMAAMAKFGITVSAEFVPWDKSRNYKPGAKVTERSLNWRVTVWRSVDTSSRVTGAVGGSDGKVAILTTDYSAGIAHCPSYSPRVTNDVAESLIFETQMGMNARRPSRSTPLLPDSLDVFWSLLQAASAIDSPDYESWAADCGFDADSRKGESIYRECLAIALKLRAALGDEAIADLRTAFEGF